MIFLLSSKVLKIGMFKPLVFGFIASAITSILVIVVGAIAATNLTISDDGILIIALVSMSIGAFFGGLISAKLLKEKGLLIGALNGLVFFFITTIISFTVNMESMTIISLIKLILFVICSMIGGVIGVNTSKKRSF